MEGSEREKKERRTALGVVLGTRSKREVKEEKQEEKKAALEGLQEEGAGGGEE